MNDKELKAKIDAVESEIHHLEEMMSKNIDGRGIRWPKLEKLHKAKLDEFDNLWAQYGEEDN